MVCGERYGIEFLATDETQIEHRGKRAKRGFAKVRSQTEFENAVISVVKKTDLASWQVGESQLDVTYNAY